MSEKILGNLIHNRGQANYITYKIMSLAHQIGNILGKVGASVGNKYC